MWDVIFYLLILCVVVTHIVIYPEIKQIKNDLSSIKDYFDDKDLL